MNKVLSFTAILALSSAFQNSFDSNFNVISHTKDDLEKADHFMTEHSETTTTVTKILTHDDNVPDYKLVTLNTKTGGSFLPQDYLNMLQIVIGKDDEIADSELHISKHNRGGNFGPREQKSVTQIVIGGILHPVLADDEAADLEFYEKDAFVEINKEFLADVNVANRFLDQTTENELNILSHINDDSKKINHFVAQGHLTKDDELFSPNTGYDKMWDRDSIKKDQTNVKNTAAEKFKKLHTHRERGDNAHNNSLAKLGEILHKGHHISGKHDINNNISTKFVKIG